MKSTKIRLIVLSFLQFFVWGAWLISLGGYMGGTLGYSGLQIGAVYATTGIASIFMPGLLGIVADRWMNTERVLGIAHLLSAVAVLGVANVTEYDAFYGLMLVHSLFYMPTIALSNAACYQVLTKNNFDVVRTFPPIRVWGTVGFIAAMWIVDLMGWTHTAGQLYLSAGAGLLMGMYSFTVPASPPVRNPAAQRSWSSAMGLD